MNYIINNIDGIKNQKDFEYECHCSMEGHINQAFARYITSSPFGFSKKGLENKLKLLVYHANKHELTINDYFDLKYGQNNYVEINTNIYNITNIKYKKELIKHTYKYESQTYTVANSTSYNDNNYLYQLTHYRKDIYII